MTKEQLLRDLMWHITSTSLDYSEWWNENRNTYEPPNQMDFSTYGGWYSYRIEPELASAIGEQGCEQVIAIIVNGVGNNRYNAMNFLGLWVS